MQQLDKRQKSIPNSEHAVSESPGPSDPSVCDDASGKTSTSIPDDPILRLIAEIDVLVMIQSPIVSCTRQEMLPIFRGALWELYNLVGMDRIKQETVRQMRHLLLRRFVQRKPMLHSVMYGPPGVGKTRLGKCLAKLWTASGIIKAAPQLTGCGGSTVDSSSSSGNETRTIASLNKENQALKGILSTISQKMKSSVEELRRLHGEHNRKKPRSAKSGSAKSGRRNHSYRERYLPLEPEDWTQFLDAVRNTEEKLNNSIGECSASKTVPSVSEEDLINDSVVLAGRGDFVARYVGQTVPKTLQFLNSHRGKVVFIDEAYLLVTDERDHFGLEAITTINQYMDQHPDEIVIIFSGYKEELQKTIFQYQKGLERRCRWVFQIDDYTPEQLGKILIQQLTIDGWQLDSSISVEKWLTDKMSSFPAFGGDMESLSFHIGLSQTDEVWSELWSGPTARGNPTQTVTDPSAMFVTQSRLDDGYRRFLKNRALDDKTRPTNHSQPPISMYS